MVVIRLLQRRLCLANANERKYDNRRVAGVRPDKDSLRGRRFPRMMKVQKTFGEGFGRTCCRRCELALHLLGFCGKQKGDFDE